MLQILLEAQQDITQTPDRDLCFVADVRLGETIGPSEDHARRLRDIRAACRQIVSVANHRAAQICPEERSWLSAGPKPRALSPRYRCCRILVNEPATLLA
jgi:hypothetical protein